MKFIAIALSLLTMTPAVAQDLTYSQYRSNSQCIQNDLSQEECNFFVKISKALPSSSVSNDTDKLERRVEALERQLKGVCDTLRQTTNKTPQSCR